LTDFGITLILIGVILWFGNTSGLFPTIPFAGYTLIGAGAVLYRKGAVAAAQELRRKIRETPAIPAVELEPGEDLPAFCVRCGEPATATIDCHYLSVSEKSEEPQQATLSLPVCPNHPALPSGPTDIRITAADRTVLVVNVSEKFASAVRERQQQRSRALAETMANLADNYESPEDFLRNLQSPKPAD
ncbi:MAG: hypothetical protein ACKOEO_26160, partial [Planctomycetaceae bacterium]